MFENLTIHSNRGIAVYERGFGKTDHISFANIRIETQLFTGHWWGKGEPIYIAVGKPQNGAGSGEISNVTFSNVSGDAESSIVLYGHPDAWLRNIVLDNVHFTMRTTRKDVSDLVGGNFDFRWTATNLKEAVFKHDIPGMFGRYVDGLHIQNSSIAWASPSPGFFSNGVQVEDFRDLDVSGFLGSDAPGSRLAEFFLRSGNGVAIRNSTAANGSNVFLNAQHISGKRLLMNNDLSNAATALKGEAVEFTQRGNYFGRRHAEGGVEH